MNRMGLYALLIAMCVADFSQAAPPSPRPAKRMTGFYWMCGTPQFYDKSKGIYSDRYLARVERNLKENKYIAGAYIPLRWNQIEPEEGKLNFDRLDRLVALMRKHKLHYKISLVPGKASPGWIYQKGAKAFQTKDSNPYHKTFDEPLAIPVPWDPVYQEYYIRVLTELSKRYSDDEYFIAIALTMANFMSPEWHLPKSQEDMRNWNSLGDPQEKIAKVWMDAIDLFGGLFPLQQLCLEASSTPIKDMNNERDQIIEYGIMKYPDRFSIQINQLMGKFDQKGLDAYDTLLAYKDRAYIGVQNVSGWHWPQAALRQGSMELSILNYLQTGARYWELWDGDGDDLEILEKLSAMRLEADTMGFEKYKQKLRNEGLYKTREQMRDDPHSYHKQRKTRLKEQ